MFGNRKLKKLTNFILSQSTADQIEVLVSASDFGLTRFANNRIHQNLVRSRSGVSIRVVVGKKIGVASAESLEKAALQKALQAALILARSQQADPDFVSLPKPARYQVIKSLDQKTADFDPQKRAVKIDSIIKQAKAAKLKAFGALSSGVTELAVANSLGVWAYFPSTQADFSTTVMGDHQASGYGSSLNSRVGDLEIGLETQKAIQVASQNAKPKVIKPGNYEVVLAPSAVNEMLVYLAYLGFGARAYHEDRSFLSGKLKTKVFHKSINIFDDALDARCLPMPFDLEGSAKKRINLIERGVAKNVVYDSCLAAKYKAKNTGHGLPAPNTLDALATHLHLEAANTSEESASERGVLSLSKNSSKVGLTEPWPSPDQQALISKVKNGLYISRLWYVNAHHHKTLTITGLTRDGTFQIKNGQIASPVVNLRFTQSIVKALNNVLGIGSLAKIIESWGGANSVPALHLGEFHFTGVSKL
ncbi:TldD/PmbA family protein [Patescibacteria group bacterium]